MLPAVMVFFLMTNIQFMRIKIGDLGCDKTIINDLKTINLQCLNNFLIEES